MSKKARDFARKKHGDQMYGKYPYIYHLDLVYNCLKEFGYDYDSNLLDAAYLHDTLEDTNTTYRELRTTFNTTVANMVWAVTGVGKDRAAKTEETILRLQVHPEAIVLKMADRLVNMRFSSKNSRKHIFIYRKELHKYAALFMQTNEQMYREMLGCYPADGLVD